MKPTYFRQFERQNNAVGRARVLSLHGKEVHFETSFSLALFSKTTEVEFMEKEPRSTGSVSITMRNEASFRGIECVKNMKLEGDGVGVVSVLSPVNHLGLYQGCWIGGRRHYDSRYVEQRHIH